MSLSFPAAKIKRRPCPLDNAQRPEIKTDPLLKRIIIIHGANVRQAFLLGGGGRCIKETQYVIAHILNGITMVVIAASSVGQFL